LRTSNANATTRSGLNDPTVSLQYLIYANTRRRKKQTKTYTVNVKRSSNFDIFTARRPRLTTTPDKLFVIIIVVNECERESTDHEQHRQQQ
jgi:hypothetical protein